MTLLKHEIDKESPVPLYAQLKEIIKDEINSSNFKPGQLIPSERELVDLFEVSRPTVRQAVNELVNEGILNKKKGLGTFVAKPKIRQQFLENLTSFQNEMREKGLPYATKVIDMKEVKTNSSLKEIFGEHHTDFFYLERLRYINNNPVVLVSTYIPKSLAEGLLSEDLTNVSLYETLQSKYGLQIHRAIRVMEAVNSSDYESKFLEIEPDAAIMFIKTTGYLLNDEIFEYSIARYRGDLSTFTVNISIS